MTGDTLARARAALESAWEEDERPSLRVRANRWTVVGAPHQLRLDREGRWWPYRREGGRWVPVGGATQDPATALASAALATGDEPRRPVPTRTALCPGLSDAGLPRLALPLPLAPSSCLLVMSLRLFPVPSDGPGSGRC